MNNAIRILALTGMLVPGSLAAQSSESLGNAVASITPTDIVARIGVIADDSMRGRQTPSPELEKVAQYIAGEFKGFGLKPGGDNGGYLQRYPLERAGLDTATSSVVIADGPTLRFGHDVIPAGASRQAAGSGKVVVLSGGAPEETGLAALNLAGAVVVIPLPSNDPLGRNSALARGLGAIMSQQPAAVVLLTPLPDAPWQATVRGTMSSVVSPGWREDGDVAPTGLALVAVREQALRPLLEKRGVNLAALLRATTGSTRATPVDLTISVTLKPAAGQNLSAPNVVGILEGSDPTLKNEYIVFSGHMDHLGVGRPDAKGDSIYNGADDDASGTIAVVEMAQAFAKLSPGPRRSMIFLTVSGEEKGLWGSEYFSMKPAVPIKQIVADLNTDMVGRNWKDTVVAIGKEHSDLGATLNRVNRAHPELRMTAIDDIWPQEDFYSRSDHFNFARKGVPILFFFNGTHADYHRPSDEVSKIDGEKESRIVKLVFYLGLDIANAAEKPKWKPESYKKIVEPARP